MSRFITSVFRWPFVLVVALTVWGPALFGLQGAHGSQSDEPPHLLLATSTTATLHRELNDAVARGYDIGKAWNDGDEMLVWLNRADEEPVGGEVHLIAAFSLETLNRELSESASAGYRLAPGGLLRNPTQYSGAGESGWTEDHIGQEGVLLLERSTVATANYEYQITIAPIRYKWEKKTRRHRAENHERVDQELRRGVQAGYQLAGLLGSAKIIEERRGRDFEAHVLLVWERARSSEGAPPVADQSERADYLFVEGYPGVELSEQVGEAAADGYVMTSVSTLLSLPGKDHLSLVMEKAEDPSTIPEYLVLSALDVEGLSNQLRAGGAQGFRARRGSFFGDPLAAVMERPRGSLRTHDYVFFETDRTATLQHELTEAGAVGRVVGTTSAHRRSYEVSDDDDAIGGLASLFGSRPSFKIETESATHLGFVEVTSNDPILAAGEEAAGVRAISLEIGKKPKDLEKELNKAARKAYRYLSLGTAPDGETVDVTFLGTTEGEATYEYRVLATNRDGTMEDELNELASEGFRLAPGGVFAKPTKMGPGLELAAVMERETEAATRHEYRLLTTALESTLIDEMSDAQGEGYEVIARLNSGRGHAAFLERSVTE